MGKGLLVEYRNSYSDPPSGGSLIGIGELGGELGGVSNISMISTANQRRFMKLERALCSQPPHSSSQSTFAPFVSSSLDTSTNSSPE